MEANSLQVHELHKKFEDLNDEIAVALRHQEDVIAQNATSSSTATTAAAATPRKDVLRLATRAINWREDVNALAKHIDLQLQHSRALRSKEAQVLSRDGETKPVEDDSLSAELRCLRSDIRMLQSFRLSYLHARRDDPASHESKTLQDQMDADGRQQSELLDKSLKVEKGGRKELQAAMVVELFKVRSELKGKISEEILKHKKLLDLEMGLPSGGASDGDAAGSGGGSGGVGGGSSGGNGSDSTAREQLASWDVQLYLRLVEELLDLQKEMKARLTVVSHATATSVHEKSLVSGTEMAGSSGVQAAAAAPAPAPSGGQAITVGRKASSVSSSSSSATATATNAPGASLDEVTFALQKLRREHGELKHAHAKLLMTTAQLDDDLVHLQRKYEDEKRAHMNEKKWYVPKIQKLEETVVTTARAFEALKLNVELLTNMYKTLRATVATHEMEEHELKSERNTVALLLSDEIKKVALLTKENHRKDKLVVIAMSARHEMCALAKRCESRVVELEQRNLTIDQRAREQADELAVAKLQLESAYARLDATDHALQAAKAAMERLQRELDVCVAAFQVQEAELKSVYDKELAQLTQRYDKTKRELMDAMSQNLSLDGRLRKAQEKITKLTQGPGDGTTTSTSTTGTAGTS